MGRMKGSILEVECPCCAAKLQVDAASGYVLDHEAPKPKGKKVDLGKAVKDLSKQAGQRDEVFQKHMDAHRKHDDMLDSKFDKLLKQQKGKPAPAPAIRDIDLD